MVPQTLPRETRLRALQQFIDFSTESEGHTNPQVAGTALEGVLPGHTLTYLRHCPDLNMRLYAYADPNPNNQVGVVPITHLQHQVYNSVHPGQPYVPGTKGLTTDGTACTYPFPSARDQYDAIRRLSGWFVAHVGDLDELVKSEPAIQDQVKKQLLDPLSYLMQTRYTNLAHVGQQQVVTNHFPRFGRATQATHAIPGRASGIPDCLLFKNRVHIESQNMCGEVKTFWAYTVATYQQVFHHNTAGSVTGRFRWSNPTTISGKLVKQIWCELAHYECNWGYSTNGQTVMLFVRSDQNTLVAGDPIPWRSPNLLQIMAGFCFASIDERLRQGLKDYLCEGHAVTW